MNILDFNATHIKEAEKLALMNYNEEKDIVTLLPQIERTPDLTVFADNGLGVVAFDGGKMLGFLCCYSPWDNAFQSAARGTFSPIHAHGVIKENRVMICKRLYQSAAEKWVKNKIAYHAIALYAHDSVSIEAMFSYGFGLRCVDAVRPLTSLICEPSEGIIFDELEKQDIVKIREMRNMLINHLSESPCFIYKTPDWLSSAESRNSRVFIAKQGKKLISFMEVMDGDENVVAEDNNMKCICGAFCLPEYRGKGISQNLLNYMINVIKAEGYNRLGVDFESFNPTASGFWLKYFTAYTNSVVRRIDECAIAK